MPSEKVHWGSFPGKNRVLSLRYRVQTSLLSKGYRELFPWGAPPSSAGMKNAWNYTPTPPYRLMVLCLIKQ
jgi:hypothetical protein